MQKIVVIFLAIFFLKFVTAVNADFNCPKEVSLDEEFTCSLKVSGGEGIYDVKIVLEKNGKTAAKIYNSAENKWSSTYYYLKAFIENNDNTELKLKIEESGDYDGILKLRQGSKTDSFDFKISVGETQNDEIKETKVIENKSNAGEKIVSAQKENVTEAKPISLNAIPPKNILLNNLSTETTEIYESKNYQISKYVPYAFCFFLIFVIAILFWEKF